MLKNHHVGLMSLLASAVMLSACQPADKSKNQNTPDQAAISEPVVVEEVRLTGSTQRVPLVVESCKGNSCPEIMVDRLSTNFPDFDQMIDQAILEYFKTTIEIDVEDVEQSAASAPSVTADQTQPASTAQSQTPEQLLAQQLQPYVNNFLKLDDSLKNMGVNHQITLSVSPKILNSQGPLATIVLNTSNYLGSAHGSSSQQYFNFDLKQQKMLTLDDVIEANQHTRLKQLAHDVFKAWVMDNKLAESVEDYEQAWKFDLSKNYYLGRQGLILQYQEYEIGPYAVGLPRLTIPYDQLVGVLKSDYLLEDIKNQSASSAVTAQPQ